MEVDFLLADCLEAGCGIDAKFECCLCGGRICFIHRNCGLCPECYNEWFDVNSILAILCFSWGSGILTFGMIYGLLA